MALDRCRALSHPTILATSDHIWLLMEDGGAGNAVRRGVPLRDAPPLTGVVAPDADPQRAREVRAPS